MKKLTWLFLALIMFSACSNDDDNDTDVFDSDYAMTAKINGETFQANNIHGDNKATDVTLYSGYPQDEYFRLAGTAFYGDVLHSIEINIFVNKNQLAVGTYEVGVDSDGEMNGNQHRHHIDLIDNTNDDNGAIFEYTISGQINITDIDTGAKKIKGTFEFIAGENSDINATVVSEVTHGTFNYDYSNISD